MANTLAIAIKIANENAKVLKELQSELQDVEAAGDKVEKEFKKVSGALDDASKAGSGLKGHLGDIGKIAAGFVVGQLGIQSVQGLVKGLGDLATKSQELELQATKASTVLGDQLGTVNAWATANAHALGLTSREAINLATNMADLLIPMGMSRQAAADMAQKTIGLAGALSEWSGGAKSATEVSEILTKAYLGETDGLKALGIAISAADIEARLAAKGQKDLTGEALAQAKAMAIQELIFEKSADAQNAFANGANSAARAASEQAAKSREAREELAAKLGPAVAMVTRKFEEFKTKGLLLAIALGEKLVPYLQMLVPFLPAIAAAVGIVGIAILSTMIPAVYAWAAAEYARAAATIAANLPLIALTVVLALVAAGVVLLVQHWDTLVQKFPVLGTIADAVQEKLQEFRDWIEDPFIPTVKQIYETVAAVVTAIADFVEDKIPPIWNGIIEPQLKIIWAGFQLYWGLISTYIEMTLGIIHGVFLVFKGLFTGDWDLMWQGVQKIFGSVWDGIKGMFNEFKDYLLNIIPEMGKIADTLGTAIGQGINMAVRGGLNLMLTAVERGLNFVLDAAAKGIRAMKALIDAVPGGNPFGDAMNAAITMMESGVSLPRLAKGGIVTKPTLALIGEAGPEAVIPLGITAGPRPPLMYAQGLAGGAPGAGGMTITGDVILSFPNVTSTNGKELARQVKFALDELARQNWKKAS